MHIYIYTYMAIIFIQHALPVNNGLIATDALGHTHAPMYGLKP